MKIVEANIIEFLEKKVQYQIPIYQRNYSWKEDNCERLLDDIIAVAEDEKRSHHFLGSIIYMSCDETQNISALRKYYVIDGQQRLTSLSLLLVALRDYAKEQLSEEECCGSEFPFDELEDYLINPRYFDDDHYKVKLIDEDFVVYKSLLNNRKLPDGVTYSQVFKNYNIFLTLLRKSKVAPSTVFSGIKKLKIGDISLVADDNAQLVFETVNSTGKSLSIPDKIRNFVLMNVEPSLQRKIYTDYWRPMELQFGLDSQGTNNFKYFFHYYTGVILKTKIPKYYYDTFKSYYLGLNSDETEKAVEEISRFAKYYKKLLVSSATSSGIEKLLYNIKSTRQLQETPAVLAIYDNYEQERLSYKDASKMLKLIESYIVRRQLCGIPSNSTGEAYVTMLKNTDSLEKFIECLFNLTDKQRFPTDDELYRVLRTANIYEDFKGDVKELLNRLEIYKNKDYIRTDSHTIEHIMPQTIVSHEDLYAKENLSDEEKEKRDWAIDLGEEWKRISETYTHTIGNLTITGYNSELQNYRFKVKRDAEDESNGKRYGYKFTPINISSSLSKLDTWGEEEILARAKEMTDIIVKIWEYPVSPDNIGTRMQKQ